MVVWKSDGIGGGRILVKEELCEKIVDVQIKSDRAMTMVMDFEKEIMSQICVCVPGGKIRRRERSILIRNGK